MFDENVISYRHLLIPVSTFESAGGVGIGRVALSSLERTEAEARLARLELEHSAALRAATDLAERTEAVAAAEARLDARVTEMRSQESEIVALRETALSDADSRVQSLEAAHAAEIERLQHAHEMEFDELAIAAERRRASEPLPEDEEPVFCDLEALLNGLDEASSTAEDDTEDDAENEDEEVPPPSPPPLSIQLPAPTPQVLEGLGVRLLSPDRGDQATAVGTGSLAPPIQISHVLTTPVKGWAPSRARGGAEAPMQMEGGPAAKPDVITKC